MTTVVESGIGSFVAGSVVGLTRMKSAERKKANAPAAARNGARLGPGAWMPGGAGALGRGRDTVGPAAAKRRITHRR